MSSTPRIYVRSLKLSDGEQFLKQVRQSRRIHRPWVQVPQTQSAFKDYVKEMNTEDDLAFLVIKKESNEMVGIVELRDIFLGDFKNSYIIYFGFVGLIGQGLMREAVQQVIKIAFSRLKLHRLEANIQPNNQASKALVQACGFQKEGFSPKFLKKGGQWRDHERWALVKG